MTLRRIVEIAGMTEHSDFTEQLHLFGEDGALRPDLVVHMPEGRDLVVDVKTPLDAYLEAIEAPTDEARVVALRRHAHQARAATDAISVSATSLALANAKSLAAKGDTAGALAAVLQIIEGTTS